MTIYNAGIRLVAVGILAVMLKQQDNGKSKNTESVYSIDSFPIPVCDNIRIPRSKIYEGEEEYRGYQASKKRYFYGIKIHLMVTASRQPVEFFLTSGSFADVKGLRVFPFALPEGSVFMQTRLTTIMKLRICCLKPRISSSRLCGKAIQNDLYLAMFSFSSTINAK
jgi:hypothetical protein